MHTAVVDTSKPAGESPFGFEENLTRFGITFWSSSSRKQLRLLIDGSLCFLDTEKEAICLVAALNAAHQRGVLFATDGEGRNISRASLEAALAANM